MTFTKYKRELPAGLFHLLTWLLFCRMLGPVVPLPWVILALPLAWVSIRLTERLKLNIPTSLIVILVIPWAIRFLFFLASAVTGGDALPRFDDGWLPTAPVWYAAAGLRSGARRKPGAAAAEALILLVATALFLMRDDSWGTDWTAPTLSTVRLLVTASALILASLSLFCASQRGNMAGLNQSWTSMIESGPLIVHILTFAALFLILFGLAWTVRREQSAASEGGGLLASDLFRFDFSEVLSLEPEISMNGELTMLYREEGPARVRYLRRYTLSGWSEEQGFFRLPDGERDYPNQEILPDRLPRSPQSWPGGLDLNARVDVRQEYYLIALDPQSFFSLNYPVSVEPWRIWDEASFSKAYSVTSRASDAGQWELYDAGTGRDVDTSVYLKGGDDPAFITLAETASQNASGPWETAKSIELWFHKEFFYSLRPGLAPDGDQLSWFINETRRGYCTYFAFAMARMCRSVGIPARVAVGFLADPQGSVMGFMPIRSDQAHAWVEVWLDDYGWITFDPTPDRMAPGEEYPVAPLMPEDWLPLVEEALSQGGIPAFEEESDAPAPESWMNRLREWRKENPTALIFTALLLVVLLYLPGRIIPIFKLLAGLHSPHPQRRIQADWRHWAGRVSRAGYAPYPMETPLQWARRIESLGIDGMVRWTRGYQESDFAAEYTEQQFQTAEGCKDAVKKAWKKLSLRVRLMSALRPGLKAGLPW